VAIVPPLGFSTRSTFYADSLNVGATGEHLMAHVGRLHRALGAMPVLYFHGFFGDGLVTATGLYKTAFDALAGSGFPVLVPELGGGSQWATPDVVDTNGFADKALAWAATNPPIVTGTTFFNATVTGIGVRQDEVAVHGWSMGSLNGLNWAWRNAAQVRAAVFVGPIVDAEKFYADNAGFQGAIDSDWGSHANFVAALPDIDPMRNLDLIRPFGHRIQLWYAEDDEFIDPADVVAFAELVGAEAHGFPGTHADLITVPADRAAIYTLAQARNRLRTHVGWDSTDWAQRMEHVVANYQGLPHNVHVESTEAAVGGRRGRITRVSGANGNERHLYLVNDMSAANMAVRTVWHGRNGGDMRGQQGNLMRAVVDWDAGTYETYIYWHNVLFGVPWIVNASRWTGTIGVSMVQNGSTGTTIVGLRRSAGGPVLASERVGGVVTLVVAQADADRAYRTGVIEVGFDGGSIGGYSGLVTRLDANHLQFAQAGGDVLSGGPGYWADFGSCFPYVADTELYGTHMRGRFYPVGMDAPSWDDPDWVWEWDDAGGGHVGYGHPGIFAGHIGIFISPPDTPGDFVQFGPIDSDEL
jgi:hypothetical protein